MQKQERIWKCLAGWANIVPATTVLEDPPHACTAVSSDSTPAHAQFGEGFKRVCTKKVSTSLTLRYVAAATSWDYRRRG
jgi:hypothetical protein